MVLSPRSDVRHAERNASQAEFDGMQQTIEGYRSSIPAYTWVASITSIRGFDEATVRSIRKRKPGGVMISACQS